MNPGCHVVVTGQQLMEFVYQPMVSAPMQWVIHTAMGSHSEPLLILRFSDSLLIPIWHS